MTFDTFNPRVLAAALLATLGLSACTTEYSTSLMKSSLGDVGFRSKHEHQRYQVWRIAPDTRIAYTLTDEINTDTPRTSRTLNNVLKQQFSEFFPASTPISSVSNLDHMLANAFNNGCELLFVPKIVTIENRLDSRYEISRGQFNNPHQEHGRDELSVQILIFETRTHELLDVATLNSKAALFKHRDQVPLHLLENSMNLFLADISARTRDI